MAIGVAAAAVAAASWRRARFCGLDRHSQAAGAVDRDACRAEPPGDKGVVVDISI